MWSQGIGHIEQNNCVFRVKHNVCTIELAVRHNVT